MTRQDALKELGLEADATPGEVRERFAQRWREISTEARGAGGGKKWHIAQQRLERLSEARIALVGFELGK